MHYLPHTKSRSLINTQQRFNVRCRHLGCYLFNTSNGVQNLSQHMLPKCIGMLAKYHDFVDEK